MNKSVKKYRLSSEEEKRNVIALVLAGGHIQGFGVLALNRAKAALPIAGFYRIIDFALSSLSNSGITKIGIIIQYLPASLIEHVGVGEAWDLSGYERLVKVMPPFIGVGTTDWFRGSADAIYRNLNFVYDHNPQEVIVTSGGHIFYLDFSEVLKFHRDKDADLTIISKQIERSQISPRLGCLEIDASSRVKRFKEKPEQFFSNIVSTGIYIFKTESLIQWLRRSRTAKPTYNLAYDLVEPMTAEARTFAYLTDGLWEYMENVLDYYRVSMSWLNDKRFQEHQRNILTNMEDRALGFRPPVLITGKGKVLDSHISPGSIIKGTVIRSIISPGVVVEEDAIVQDSILMHDCKVLGAAQLYRVVADKDVLFNCGCIVGEANGRKAVNPEVCPQPLNLVLIGKGTIIGEGIKVNYGCQVYPGVDLGKSGMKEFPPGVNIRS